jgi:hypothetical protein
MQAATEREVDHPRPGEPGAWAWAAENAKRGAQDGAEARPDDDSTHGPQGGALGIGSGAPSDLKGGDRDRGNV